LTRGVRWLGQGVAAALLIACSAAGPGPSSATPTPSSTPSSARTVAAADADNGRTVSLQVGQRLEVRLSSTYWTFGGSSNTAVLRPAGPPVVSPQTSGCVPGGGCGSVRAVFDAVATGRADVTAARTSCGEALRCTAEQSSYRLTVSVA
jgi:hypothetical protein